MKFLVIRFSSIGDIVLTTAAIRCLKQQVPDAEIHFLTKESFKAVTLHNPYIAAFHYFTENLGTTIKELQQENFDYIIDNDYSVVDLNDVVDMFEEFNK